MKVLWVEDHPRAQEMLSIAAGKAVRKRLRLDLVIAPRIFEAERYIRQERFDLVVLDLCLPDSLDEGMTLARIASMGNFRLAIVSSSEHRDAIVASAIRSGCNCAPRAVAKEELPFERFIQRPDEFCAFLQSLMPAAADVQAA